MTYILRKCRSGDTQKSHLTKRYPPPSLRRSIQYSFLNGNLGSSVDQAEDVVENEEATGTVGAQREELGVVHGLLLLIDLIASKGLE